MEFQAEEPTQAVSGMGDEGIQITCITELTKAIH
jgi:hypothetical protein